MNVQTAKTPKHVLETAKIILDKYRANYAEYLEDCESDRANGHRPHYCIHGVNMWVDYDCACGLCEEYGNSWDYTLYASWALSEARKAWAEFDERMSLLIGLMKRNAPVHTAELTAWVSEPLAPYKK